MVNYAKQLETQVTQLEKLLQQVEQRLAENQAPETERIWVTNQKKGFQYYLVDGSGKREYVPKADMEQARAIVQRDYDEAVMKKILEVKYRIKRFLNLYDMDPITQVYEKLCDARKALVTPIIPTDEEFIESWKQHHVGERNTYPLSVTYQTEQGELVRSKSEKILADLFLKYGIPYVYEPQLRLKNDKVIYPDFALLNVQTRKTIYWEHFGLASEGEYATHALQKLQDYEKRGIVLGEKLLISIESQSAPLDIRLVEEKVKKNLL